jgi:hypothetical protein
MTLQLLHSEFPYRRGKFYFIFYQCGAIYTVCSLWTGVQSSDR